MHPASQPVTCEGSFRAPCPRSPTSSLYLSLAQFSLEAGGLYDKGALTPCPRSPSGRGRIQPARPGEVALAVKIRQVQIEDENQAGQGNAASCLLWVTSVCTCHTIISIRSPLILTDSLKLKLPGYRSFYICYILSGLFPDAID